jgi:hypothetical protein
VKTIAKWKVAAVTERLADMGLDVTANWHDGSVYSLTVTGLKSKAIASVVKGEVGAGYDLNTEWADGQRGNKALVLVLTPR